jgi:transcription initiation factor TFIID subunit 7
MLYPAQLVNLPCPVEVHKTLDRASYFKAADVAQMLVVFEDKTALDQAQEKPSEGFPSYYHSGLTPPMKRVVERRLERRFTSRDRKAVPPSRTAVQDVEEQLLELMEKLQKDEKWTGKRSSKLPVLTSATKDLEEVDEEVVDYEPWMDDGGNQPLGIEFDAEDHLSAKVHPEIWLPPDTIRAIKEETKAAEEAALAAAAAAAAAAAEKPTTKKKKSKKKAAAAAAAAAAEADKGPQPKKGIASKKNKAVVDELTQAAMTMTDDLMADVLGDDDFFAGFDMDFDMDGNV